MGALLVVSAHYAPPLLGAHFFSHATSVFFLTCGFLAFAPAARQPRRGWPYLQRRLWRLYPGFAVAALLYGITHSVWQADWWAIAWHHATLFLLSHGAKDVFTLNPAFWSLPVFVTFYALLAMLPRLFSPTLWQWAILAMLPFAVEVAGWHLWRGRYLELLALPLHLHAFWLGGLLRQWQLRYSLTVRHGYSLAAFLCIGLIVTAGLHQPALEALLPGVMGFRLMMILLFAVALWLALHSPSARHHWRLITPVAQLGFGLYLLHNLPLQWFNLLPVALPGGVAAATGLAVSLLLAWCLRHGVEQPLQRMRVPRHHAAG